MKYTLRAGDVYRSVTNLYTVTILDNIATDRYDDIVKVELGACCAGKYVGRFIPELRYLYNEHYERVEIDEEEIV